MTDLSRTRQRQLVQQIRSLLDELERLDDPAAPELTRPAEPTATWCMRPPATVRWDDETTLPPTPWAILRAILTLSPHGEAVPIESIEDVIGRELEGQTLKHALVRLNKSLEKIGWPRDYSVQHGYIVRN